MKLREILLAFAIPALVACSDIYQKPLTPEQEKIQRIERIAQSRKEMEEWNLNHPQEPYMNFSTIAQSYCDMNHDGLLTRSELMNNDSVQKIKDNPYLVYVNTETNHQNKILTLEIFSDGHTVLQRALFIKTKSAVAKYQLKINQPGDYLAKYSVDGKLQARNRFTLE